MNRRRYLTTLGTTVSVLAFPGCSNDSGNDRSNGEEDRSDANGRNETSETSGAVTTNQSQNNTGNNSATQGLYTQQEFDSLILGLDAFPDGWQIKGEGQYGRTYENGGGTTFVIIKARILEGIQTAKNEFPVNSRYYTMEDTNEYNLADEAYWVIDNNGIAQVRFRHSNAIGNTSGYELTDGNNLRPKEDLAQQYADRMFEKWNDIR